MTPIIQTSADTPEQLANVLSLLDFDRMVDVTGKSARVLVDMLQADDGETVARIMIQGQPEHNTLQPGQNTDGRDTYHCHGGPLDGCVLRTREAVVYAFRAGWVHGQYLLADAGRLDWSAQGVHSHDC